MQEFSHQSAVWLLISNQDVMLRPPFIDTGMIGLQSYKNMNLIKSY